MDGSSGVLIHGVCLVSNHRSSKEGAAARWHYILELNFGLDAAGLSTRTFVSWPGFDRRQPSLADASRPPYRALNWFKRPERNLHPYFRKQYISSEGPVCRCCLDKDVPNVCSDFQCVSVKRNHVAVLHRPPVCFSLLPSV